MSGVQERQSSGLDLSIGAVTSPDRSQIYLNLIQICQGYFPSGEKFKVGRYLLMQLLNQVLYDKRIKEPELALMVGAIYQILSKHYVRWSFFNHSELHQNHLAPWKESFIAKEGLPETGFRLSLLGVSAGLSEIALDQDDFHLKLWRSLLALMAKSNLTEPLLHLWVSSVLAVMQGNFSLSAENVIAGVPALGRRYVFPMTEAWAIMTLDPQFPHALNQHERAVESSDFSKDQSLYQGIIKSLNQVVRWPSVARPMASLSSLLGSPSASASAGGAGGDGEIQVLQVQLNAAEIARKNLRITTVVLGEMLKQLGSADVKGQLFNLRVKTIQMFGLINLWKQFLKAMMSLPRVQDLLKDFEDFEQALIQYHQKKSFLPLQEIVKYFSEDCLKIFERSLKRYIEIRGGSPDSSLMSNLNRTLEREYRDLSGSIEHGLGDSCFDNLFKFFTFVCQEWVREFQENHPNLFSVSEGLGEVLTHEDRTKEAAFAIAKSMPEGLIEKNTVAVPAMPIRSSSVFMPTAMSSASASMTPSRITLPGMGLTKSSEDELRDQREACAAWLN